MPDTETAPRAVGVAGPARRALAMRWHIAALIVVLILPGLVYAAVLVARYAEAERARFRLEALDTSRQVTTAIDRDLMALATNLQTLATSPRLSIGNLGAFHTVADQIARLIDAEIRLRTLSGQQLVNTATAWEAPLARTRLAIDAEALTSRAPVVSDVFIDPLTGRPACAVVVPIEIDGQPQFLLDAVVSTDRIAAIARRDLSKGWIIGVGDRQGIYVARSERHDEVSGKPAVAAYLALATAREGTFIAASAFGEPILAGYLYSPLSGWLVAANIPTAVFDAPLRRQIALLVGVGLAILAFSLLFAAWLSRAMTGPLARLAQAGDAISRGEAVPRVTSPVAEIDRLGAVVSDASADLVARLRERDRMEAALRASEERLAELLALESAGRHQAETQLHQLQKMEAVGRLSGGIAHDFNNMLAVVMSALTLVQKRLARGDTNVGELLEAGMDGAGRAATLTKRLLAFSRQQPLEPQAIDPNKLVAGMSDMLQRTIGEAMRVETVLAGGVWRIHADPVQLESAIVNLAVNARDAMPQGGRLTVETANCHLDDAYAGQNVDVTPGQYVMIAVTDTGAGMPPETLARAFEPFFTTKPPGQGTGLGLSQVYGFVRQSGGHAKIYSEGREGTTVKLYLPRFRGAASEAARAEVVAPERRGGAEEVILVVEDDERVRAVSVEALAELGYTVLEADGGAAALRLLDAHPEIALMFTDVVMPDMNGRRLADEARQRRPAIKILFTTGFTRNAVIHNGVLDPGVAFLAKPFTLRELGAKISEVLAGKP